MADDLRIRSGAGNAVPSPAAKEKTVDKDSQELERLRNLAKERSGRSLDDNLLRAIAQRKKAAIAEKQAKLESKQTHEATQSRETLRSSRTDPQLRAEKAFGAKEVRGADGLTDADRTAVRSDPKAGPKLPPTDAKATTVEQAKIILAKMFAHVHVDGKPLDFQEYARGINQRPPAKANDGASKNEGAPTRQRMAFQRPGGQGPGLVTTQRSQSGLSPSGPALAMQRAGNTPSGPRPSVSAARQGLHNAGGGLDSKQSFDGLRFNWGAFLIEFMIRSKEDASNWRGMMKELHNASQRAFQAGVSLDVALLEMRHQGKITQAVINFDKAAKSAEAGFKKGMEKAAGQQAQELMSGNTVGPREQAQARQNLRDRAGALRGERAPPQLSEDELEELSPEERSAYDRQQRRARSNSPVFRQSEQEGMSDEQSAQHAGLEEQMREDLGLGGMLEQFAGERDELRRELANAEQDGLPQGEIDVLTSDLEDLDRRIGELESEYENDLGELLGSDTGAQAVMRQRGQMREELRQLDNLITADSQRQAELGSQLDELPQDDPQRPALQAQHDELDSRLNNLRETRGERARELARADHMIATQGPRPQPSGVEAVQGRQQRGVETPGEGDSNDGPAITTPTQERHYQQLSRLALQDRTEGAPAAEGSGDGADGDPFAQLFSGELSPEEQRQAVDDAIHAADVLFQQDLPTEGFWSKALSAAESGAGFLAEIAQKFEQFNQPFVEAVNRGVQSAKNTAAQNSDRINAQVSSRMKRAQGMHNQLMQILGLMHS